MNVKKYLRNPGLLVPYLGLKGCFTWLPDETYLRLAYRATFGKKLDLENPRSFNEKLQWLKLYDRNPEYTRMVDKYAAKAYVAEKVGWEYVVPALGVWDHFDEIDFDSLPNQFVLKCTHDSGGLVVVQNKTQMDRQAAREKIEKSLKRNYYAIHREYPYKNIAPRILAEPYLQEQGTEALKDYKFFCFQGEPKAMFIAVERSKIPEIDFFDMDFSHLPFWEEGERNAQIPPERPECFDRMKELSSVLSQDIPFLRVDFYEVNGRLYVGELTFYHGGGFCPILPRQWDDILGDWICLPKEKREK